MKCVARIAHSLGFLYVPSNIVRKNCSSARAVKASSNVKYTIMGRWAIGIPVSFPLQWHFSPRLAQASESHVSAGHSERTRENIEDKTVNAKKGKFFPLF